MTGLEDILSLVGDLNDKAGEDTPRERFRAYLSNKVKDVGTVRDYIEECLRTSGTNYSRALQDLVNHLGSFLGFEVRYGRYSGVQGQIGFDGHWVSPTGLHVIVEVKTTDVYSIRTSVLLGYVTEMVSEKMISDVDSALGLYVFGRSDSEAATLDSSIRAEKQTHRLRIVGVQSLLALADLVENYDLTHVNVLTVLKPSGPTIDPVVTLVMDVLTQQKPEPSPPRMVDPEPAAPEAEQATKLTERQYWLTPVAADETMTADEVIQSLVGAHGIYAFATNTPGRKALKAGDMICWYAQAKGIVAHATIRSSPVERQHAAVRNSDKYRWVFEVGAPGFYFENPVILDSELRQKLSLFSNPPKGRSWGLIIRSTRRITAGDFALLTR